MSVAVQVVDTTCPYCGVGCGVRAEHRGGELIAVSGADGHPANHGRLCVKGSALADTQTLQGRLLAPQVHGRTATWTQALDAVALGFAEALRHHGPGSVAMYLSGQLLTEDYYVANKLMKGYLGSANVDTNSRLCMASAVAAHQRAFGEDVVPCDYDDLEQCELAVLVGSNAAWAHPVLFQRLAARRERGDLRIVVVDPRRTATCEAADLHLALRPGADVALFNGLLAHLADTGAVNSAFVRDHTAGFEAALTAARNDAALLPQATGLARQEVETFFRWFADSSRTVTLFSQGVNQASNGTDKANAIINCHLATGRIGRPGAGPFSITGQPNAMGGREVGGMANQLAAHGDFSAAALDRVGRFWNATALARTPGQKAVDLFQAVGRGEIKALWIMGTNPVVSLPRADEVAEALDRCPLVVVSDCVAHTDTTVYADVLLPAAGWGEKDGTVTNSERRISRQRAFSAPPGEARPDWWIVTQVARRLGFAEAFGYKSPHDIFCEHAALTAFENRGSRCLDLGALAGLSAADYDALTPVRWPCPTDEAAGEQQRPFADGRFFHADGRARLVTVRHRLPGQRPDPRHPFVLNTGRLRDQWHTMTRTGTAPRLFGHTDTPTVHVASADVGRLGIDSGDLVEISNSGGSVLAVAESSGDVTPGQLFMPMHWSGSFSGRARVGVLVDCITDPQSGQPESKHAAVALKRRAAGAWVRLASSTRVPTALLADPVMFWTRVPTEHGWRYELALAPHTDIDRYLGRLCRALPHDNRISYTDSAGSHRRLLLEQTGMPRLVLFCAPSRMDLPAASYAAQLLDTGSHQPPWRLLAGPDGLGADSSRQVCTCFGISETRIREALAAGAASAAELGRTLQCGTNCGSCIPELNALIAAVRGSKLTEVSHVGGR